MDDGLVRLVAVARDNEENSAMEVVLQRVNDPLFRWSIFGRDDVDMGVRSMTDSYDSTTGTYASQLSGDHAGDEGDVASNGPIQVGADADVYGNAIPGPSDTVSLDGSATVTGATTPAVDLITLPITEFPTTPSVGDRSLGVDLTIPSGDYSFDHLQLADDMTLTVIGPATLLMHSFQGGERSKILVDDTAGPVAIYAQGDFILGNEAGLTSLSQDPASLSVWNQSDQLVQIGTDAYVHGTIMAPRADVDFGTRVQVFGAVVGATITMGTDCEFHYDTNLRNLPGGGDEVFDVLAWQPLSLRDPVAAALAASLAAP